MNIYNLTLKDITAAADSDSPEIRRLFDPQADLLLEQFASPDRKFEQQVTSSIANFFSSMTGVKYFKRRGIDCARCEESGYITPTNKLVPVYRSYQDYLSQKCIKVSPRILGNMAMLDDELGVHFTERCVPVLYADFTTKHLAGSHANHKREMGQFYKSQISRNTWITSTFDTNFYGNKNAPKDWVVPDGDTVGIEIEMLFPDVISKLKFSTWLNKEHRGWHCEYDGSLQDHGNAGDNGLELISPPLLVDDMMRVIEPICLKAIELGGMGFPAGIFYGMHVTNRVPKMIRGGATRDEIASRYICLLNAPELRPFWQVFARRKGESFLTYCPFKDVKMETCLVTETGPGMGRDAHRRAVFVRNKTLLETRIFRSNLNVRQVRANIEICYLTMLFCRGNQFSLTDLSKYVKFLEDNMSDDLKKILYRPKNTPMAELVKASLRYNVANQPQEDYNQ
jgi:hypothetical protein